MRNRIVYYNRAGQIMPADGLGEFQRHDMLFRDRISRGTGIGMVERTPVPGEDSVRIIVRVEGNIYSPDDIFEMPLTPPAASPPAAPAQP